jgi:type IV pilus assembly protein PilW
MTTVSATSRKPQTGLTIVELMVALAIGSFLMIGAVQIYNQSRQSFIVNDSIAKVQETAQFAMDTIEADLRMASNWGRNSRGLAVEGRSIIGDPNPKGLPVPTQCGVEWVLDFGRPVDGDNNSYTLPCAPPAAIGPQPNSDFVTVRRATVASQPLDAGRLQVQSTRIQGELFTDGNVPTSYSPADSATHNVLINTYYVADDSELIPGVPALRRLTLTTNGASPEIEDQEVAPGVENMQVQFGVDVDQDNTVDRYVNPGDDVYNPAAAGYIPGARIITARVWLVVRGIDIEVGIRDTTNYAPGDIALGTYSDQRRRLQVSKTILLRNART